MDAPHGLLFAATLVALYEMGQIWYAQIVVYPLFAKVGAPDYIEYHGFYTSKIPLPVIIPGFASFLLPMVLIFVRPDTVPAWSAYANALCGLIGLLVTVVLEIPRHGRLEKVGKQPQVIRELIRFNWPRTASVTGSAVFSAFMLLAAFRPA